MHHAPIWSCGVPKTGCNLIELFTAFKRGSSTKPQITKIPITNFTKRKLSQNLLVCIKSGLHYYCTISLCSASCHYFGKFKKPIWNRIDFPQALHSGSPSEQPCQPSENPVHPTSFTQINPIWANNWRRKKETNYDILRRYSFFH